MQYVCLSRRISHWTNVVISTYDEATQAHIRKILFDQRQERLGKPTSDEIIMEGKGPKSLPEGVEYIDQEKMNEIKGKP